MANTFVTDVDGALNSGTSLDVTITPSTTSGKLICSASSESGAETLSVSDDVNGTYAKDAEQAASLTTGLGVGVAGLHSVENTSSGLTTVTGTLTATGIIIMNVMEFTGMQVLTPVSATGVDSGDAVAISLGITPGADDTIVSSLVVYGSILADTGYTLTRDGAWNASYHATEHDAQVTAGLKTLDWGGVSKTNFGAVAVAYKTASAAASGGDGSEFELIEQPVHTLPEVVGY